MPANTASRSLEELLTVSWYAGDWRTCHEAANSTSSRRCPGSGDAPFLRRSSTRSTPAADASQAGRPTCWIQASARYAIALSSVSRRERRARTGGLGESICGWSCVSNALPTLRTSRTCLDNAAVRSRLLICSAEKERVRRASSGNVQARNAAARGMFCSRQAHSVAHTFFTGCSALALHV